MSASFLAWVTIAAFGTAVAFIVPTSYSLAVRVSELAPDHEEYLGYVLGAAQIFYLVLSPLIGLWSDGTRSRFGRRSPFIVGGSILGFAALVGIALAPNVTVMALIWMFGLLGWGTSQQAIINRQADRVPEEQRGRISALSGVANQIAPAIGVGIAAAVHSNIFLVFVVPGLIGLILSLTLPFIKREASTRHMLKGPAVTAKMLFSSYIFNPRESRDFAWNWLGRFIFFIGLYFNTSYATFFYAQRLGLPVKDIAGTVAIIGLSGVVIASVAGLLGGFLSDKLRRRRLFILIGALVFVVGGITEAFAHSFAQLLVGAAVMQLSIAAFNAVDQAIVLAVIPDRSQIGRYLAVVAFAQKIPSAIAPLIATVILTLTATEAGKDYTSLYLLGTALALVGGLLIFFRVKSVR
ncbi:MFS transporter [Arthrobacter sp. Soil761]|uniref:MFS transporter n=1 Tax=Arthrobacter sp. Soil761 TaxID=1736400 RepID=UPI001F2F616C|nr:MFS transporter [Arthrobacter sp. Soil761]